MTNPEGKLAGLESHLPHKERPVSWAGCTWFAVLPVCPLSSRQYRAVNRRRCADGKTLGGDEKYDPREDTEMSPVGANLVKRVYVFSTHVPCYKALL